MTNFNIKKEGSELYSYISKNRYKLLNLERTKQVYRFDKWLFNLYMFLTFGFLFYVAWISNFQLDYYYCGEYNGCDNPFYKQPDWKNTEHLPQGEYGTPPTGLFKSIFYVTVFGFVLSFVANHLLHNRKFNFKRLTNE